MALLQAILQKVKSTEIIRYPSPPPGLEEEPPRSRRKYKYQYANVRAKVDHSAPFYEKRMVARRLPALTRELRDIIDHNYQLLAALRKRDLKGKVDHYWTVTPKRFKCYYETRVNFYRNVEKENRLIYKRIQTAGPKVESAEQHRRDWARNRRNIVERAQAAFVLFPPIPHEHMEDQAFRAAEGVKRPRVFITLGIKGGATIGELQIELFTEVSPRTCQLFLELLEGDGLGHCYVGTSFFTKVPHMFWSGGDVIHDNGFGCYAQRGRDAPVGAENYHFSHTMPGLLTMRVTRHNEMCGIFSVTFKPLQQFDLKSVVFGRVIRPSETYNCISAMGAPLSPRPIVYIRAARR